MKIFIIFMIILFVIIGVAVVFLLRYNKKLKEQAQIEDASGTSMKEGGITAQQFLPFKSITDGIVDLGGFQYRMYIECSSINYDLKTQMEQEVLEKSFKRFVNSFSYPFAFYIQTREIDARNIVKGIEDDAHNINKKYADHRFDGLKRYAQVYLNDTIEMNRRLSSVKQKRKYIIITYDDAAGLSELSDEEKESRSLEQIRQRANSVATALSSIGIHGHVLDQKEVIELLFRAINKESIGTLDGLVDGSFLVPIVHGNDSSTWEFTHPAAKMDVLLVNALDALSVEVINNPQSDEISKETAGAVYDEISKIRRKYAGWYKEGE